MLERELVRRAASLDGVFVAHHAAVQTCYATLQVNDPFADEAGHIPYSEEYFAVLGTVIARWVFALRGAGYQTLVLDDDGVLWAGSLTAAGVQDIQISPAHRRVHEQMTAQYEAGWALYLCSHNREADIRDVFQRHPDTPLRIDHIAGLCCDDRPICDQVRALLTEAALSPNTAIYLSANAAHCTAVRECYPAMLVIQLPSGADELAAFLNHLWGLDSPATFKTGWLAQPVDTLEAADVMVTEHG
jgi:predicted enzyme involved in methoxymalonyl-ACP biosynthesis